MASSLLSFFSFLRNRIRYRSANVNARAVNLSTLMHSASGNGHLDIVKLLVERGASVDSRTGGMETPLSCAAGSGFIDIVRFLIKSGATMSSRDNQGWTPFHKASKHISTSPGSYWSVESMSTFEAEVKRRHYIWHPVAANSTLHVFSSSMAQISTLRTTRVRVHCILHH
jgi:hypothetical protein